MNGCNVVLVVVISSMIINGGLVKGLRGKKGTKHQHEFLTPSKNYESQKEQNDMVKSRTSRKGLPEKNMRAAFNTGTSYAETKAKMVVKQGSLVARDQLSEADSEVSALPYIALPPNNVLPDDDKKKISISKLGNRNSVTKQHIPVTAIPLVVTATASSTIQIPPSPKPPIPTPTPHSTTHPTPQPVNINLVLPTMPPIVQKPSPPLNHPKELEESNVTKIDLSLNIGEEHQKERPVIIQVPPTNPPSGVGEVVSQIQKAQEMNSQLSLLANTPLQRPLQGPPLWNTPSVVASMLGMRNPPYNPLSIEEMMSQNGNPYGYPPWNVPPNSLPFQETPGFISTLQQGLMRPNNPLMGPFNANQMSPVSSLSNLLSNALKSSLSQSQPDLITSALSQAALQVQAQKQPPQMLTSALTQAIAKIVSQNGEPSEEQKLTEILGAALNLPKGLDPQKRFLPTASSLKVEIVNPTTSPLLPLNPVLKQGKFIGPGEQQIISLNVSPFLPQQNPGSLSPVLPQQNPGNVPPVLPQPNPANTPPVLPQPNLANAPSLLSQPNVADTPPVLSQPNSPNAPPLPQPQVFPPQNSPANSPPMPPNTANVSPVSPQIPNQQASYNTPILDQITASALGKAMAKALVNTAKKIVYNKPATQRDRIISNNNIVHFPRRLQNFIRTTFFHSNKIPHPYLRTFLPINGLNALRPPFGPFKMRYLRHRYLCCYC
ncbi:proline-rich protein 36-like [Actinia tenebrosa]|uniref:Proline-rich protein 36-like n=1 Tax=Actinia tenebrosa TaxID=6105 RepID=A0A6P8IT63_ACTTE|nr:proline-rich protein 36-like [Actinia tenebrosa]